MRMTGGRAGGEKARRSASRGKRDETALKIDWRERKRGRGDKGSVEGYRWIDDGREADLA